MAKYIVGLTGGVASGKSEVTRLFEALGVTVADADLAAREAVAVGSAGLAEVVDAFGSSVLTADGSLDRPELVGLYVAADIAWVTPLRDGLNLVAKEYVAAQIGGTGALILSEFAGAAAELRGAILTNPYSPDDMDRALEDAMDMDEGERTGRMLMLRDRVLSWDVHRWSQAFLNAAERAGAAAAGT